MVGSIGRTTARILNRVVPKRLDHCAVAGFPDVEDGVVAVSEALVASGRRVTALTSSSYRGGGYGPRVRVVRRTSVRGLWAYMRSAHVFVSHGVYDDLVRPDRQVLVNLWHGESPGKRSEGYLGAAPKPFSYSPVLSLVGQAYRCTEFGLPPANVPVLGSPRNDRMLRASRDRARSAFDLDGVAPCFTMLWMPTYRALRTEGIERYDSRAGYAGLPFSEQELMDLDRALAAHEVRIFVKLHPGGHGAYRIETRNIVPLGQDDLSSRELTTYTALPAFDALVTDVSSIWIDYLLLDRPLVFAFPDIDEYRRRRGLEVEPFDEWVAGPLVRSVDEFVDEAAKLAQGDDPYRRRRARMTRLLHRHHDDGATRRLVDFIFAADD